MIKVSTFLAEGEYGLAAVPLFGAADAAFEKTASAGLLPEVVRYIGTLRPRKDAQYVLVNALGAGEYFGSNINGDHFPEEALMHQPDGWTGNPLIDKPLSQNWPYGYPTFYNAHPFAHHKNKDPSRAYGEVELAVWNDHMKRVELVVRVDYDKCLKFGGVPVWDRLKVGQFPDVSMGSKVPWDLCSICGDWETYRKALATFDPKRHKHPGVSVLEYHKKLKAKNGVGIRGLSVTRSDYCDHASKSMNRILPDGRKSFVYNFFPRFFDISFVFIGADRTAKVMVFIVRAGQRFSVPSVLAAETMGLSSPADGEKTASVRDDLLAAAFLKGAEEKKSEIEKEIVPSQFAGKAIPLLTRNEQDLPEEAMDALCAVPLHKALSTLTGMGMVLRPREFKKLLARSDEASSVQMSEDDFMPALARILRPLMGKRSGLGPYVERRVVMISSSSPKSEVKEASSLPAETLRKIGSAYDSYRRGVMELVASTQDLIKSAASSTDVELHKLAEAQPEELFTPLAYQYLSGAFKDEAPFAIPAEGMVENDSAASVERGLPSRNTWM